MMNDFYRRRGKRWLDLFMTSCAVFCAFPLLFVVAVMVRCALGRPVLFCQERTGLYDRPFRLYKFRTMTDRRDAAGQPLPDADRLTPFGRWLRSTSLDELPELWNVLRGEMSLVGPRPLLTEYLKHYTPEQAQRHQVLPGITGLAQVNGRNAATWAARLHHDVWYVRNVSLWLDLKILCWTIVALLSRRGISAVGHATMPPFTSTIPQHESPVAA